MLSILGLSLIERAASVFEPTSDLDIGVFFDGALDVELTTLLWGDLARLSAPSLEGELGFVMDRKRLLEAGKGGGLPNVRFGREGVLVGPCRDGARAGL